MRQKNNDFQKKLIDTFRIEATERVGRLTNDLLRLEKSADPAEQAKIVESLFRETHSLKGAARAVSSSEIERLCQSLENVFSSLKQGQTAKTADLIDILHRAVDRLGLLLPGYALQREINTTDDLSTLAQRLEDLSSGVSESGSRAASPAATQGQPPHPRPPASASPPKPPETVRIATEKLDLLMRQAEQLLSMKLAGVQRSTDLQSILEELRSWKNIWADTAGQLRGLQHSTEQNGGRIRVGGNVSFQEVLDRMVASDLAMNKLEESLVSAVSSSFSDHRLLSSMVDSLLENAKQALMFPFSSLLDPFPKLVRDLARDQNKEVDFAVQGGDIEIDRRVLEALKDPLIHLIRNCVDHGMGLPDERRRKGKPPRGTIGVSVSQKDGSKIEIAVFDDGGGIDPAAVRSAAVRSGIVTESEAGALTDSEALGLIFESGVSTSPIITDVSGRGLGLAIVRERVEGFGGSVSVDSQPGRGSTFFLRVPLTMATYRAVLISVQECIFAVPSASVERVVNVHKRDIRTLENREAVTIDGEILSLARFDEVLGLVQRPETDDGEGRFPGLVLNALNKRLVFLADAVLKEQEILVKGLGPQLARVRNIGGATVLPSGKVVPILNVPDLIRSAVRLAGGVRPAPRAQEMRDARGEVSVLVVEDSITARTLVKSILTAAGYAVTTATDGVDALTRLRTSEFDIVISDVDMPRLNGFDLTAKIRSDKRLSELPIILVTALESREDRERGIEAGANAYIVKSSFDQSNLLEAIKRLV